MYLHNISCLLSSNDGPFRTGFEDPDGDEEQEILSGVRDPFDVVTPDDLIDGIPIDEQKFWQKVTLHLKRVILRII
jgi:hypothetical protein